MQTWILFAIIIGGLVVVGVSVVLFVLVRNVRTAQGPAMHGKYPQGHWMGIGMLIGLAIGFVPSFVGILFDDMSALVATGLAIGCGLGVAIGSALEQKHKNEIRPLTEAEQNTRNWAIGIGMLIVLLSVLALGGMLLFVSR
ncbi:hypothetical protein ANRL1_03468 [Anaerolineae bacterium]|nr:hypothetical protein ANRL1_03468 [Anaerolineae bacterium]